MLFLLSGTASAISINNEIEFLKIGTDPAYPLTGNYELTNNLNFTGMTFVPIGSGTSPFTGTFDGQRYEITGIDYSIGSGSNYGIFRNLNNSEIKNLTIDSSKFSISGSNGHSVGILAGQMSNGSVITNITITNCSVDSVGDHVGMLAGRADNSTISNIAVEFGSGSTNCIVSGNSRVGGLVGLVSNSTIKDAYVEAYLLTAMGDKVGGLVSDVNNSTIQSCFYIGNITGGTNAGGFVGDVNNSVIQSGFFVGNITGTDRVGGFAGRIERSSISQCFSIVDSPLTGNNMVGGFVGVIRDSLGTETSSIENSFSMGAITGASDVGSFVGRVNQNVTLQITSSYAFCFDDSSSQFDLLFINYVLPGPFVAVITVDDSFNLYDTAFGSLTYGIPIDENQFIDIDTFKSIGGLIATDWDITASSTSNSIWYADGALPPQLRFEKVDNGNGRNNEGSNVSNGRGFGHAYIVHPNDSSAPTLNSSSEPEIIQNIPDTPIISNNNIQNENSNNPETSGFNWRLSLLLLIGIVIVVCSVFYILNKNRS